MSDDLPISQRLVIPSSFLSYEFSRSGGPGGQHVNTADTRVRIRFAFERCMVLSAPIKQRIRAANSGKITDAGDILVVCDSHRSRHRNIEVARERLAELIRASLTAPKKRRKTKPSRNSQKRRMDAKKRRGNVKKKRGKVDDY